MTAHPAISLHQPWATLCATPVPCHNVCQGGEWNSFCSAPHFYVKRFETRPRPCPPKYIGQRIAIHAAKRRPVSLYHAGWTAGLSADGRWGAMSGGRWVHLPLGAVVATAVITRSLPIYHVAQLMGDFADRAVWPNVQTNGPGVLGVSEPDEGTGGALVGYESIVDQEPYGDWTPGRWAWELTDVEPLAVPVQWKGRQGWFEVELP